MKKIVKVALALGVSLGVAGMATTTASANSQYSASRSNSVRLVWRRSMGRYAYTATKGARYSMHLGIRYSNNDVTPTVTWYTDMHEKLYEKYKRRSAIYYHVKSADGTLQGWIWRGYLKSSTTNMSNTTSSSNSGTKQNAQQPAKTNELDPVITQSMLKDLFPGTIYDLALTNAAKEFIGLDDFGQVSSNFNQEGLEHWVSPRFESFNKLKFIKFFSQDPTSEKSVEQALIKANFDQDARSTYKGWYIGGAALGLDDIEEGVEPGEGLIFLIQK